VRKKKNKKKRKKKKTIKENVIKMKWLYSSRNSINSLRKEDLTMEKGKRRQDKKECAMSTSLPNAYMRGRKKTIIGEISLTKAIRNMLRKNLMVKLILVKNETQVMRVPSRKVMKWQP
jgi:hypothetical protein